MLNVHAWFEAVYEFFVSFVCCTEKCDAKAAELGEKTGGEKEQEERGKTEKETEPAR